MQIVSVFNQKGGSGKTMLSVHLAVAAHQSGRKVAILDLDPQGSAAAWAALRSIDAILHETCKPIDKLDAVRDVLADVIWRVE